MERQKKKKKKKKKHGFPIKDFGNDGGGSFLSVSIRNLYNGRGHPYGSKKKKQKLGCLIKDFRHDRKVL